MCQWHSLFVTNEPNSIQLPALVKEINATGHAPSMERFSLGTSPAFGHDSVVGITPQQFQEMQKRLTGAKPRPTALLPFSQSAASDRHQVIIGIDPSLRGTGYGIIRLAKPHHEALAFGTIHCPQSWENSRCLLRISQEIRAVVKEHQPTVCIVEGLFYAQNLKTALTMGEARGASLVTAAEAGLTIYEIAPRKVKSAIVGYGAAQKSAVAKMVQRMLQLPELPAPDAADALALALAHAQHAGGFSFAQSKKI
jgi:crossover junction endodeoxyribonuclease RuvC